LLSPIGVTGNGRDFDGLDLDVVNPFEAGS
jgi:hypothetical protein